MGSTADEYVITATNTGGSATTPGEPITIADQLPAGIVATGISGVDTYTQFPYTELACQTAPLECTYIPSEVVDVGDVLQVTITVEAPGPFSETEPVNHVTIIGGGATEASTSDPTVIGSSPAAYGIAALTTSVSTVQAGAHPNITTAFSFNQSAANVPASDPKDIDVELPPGIVGDPNPNVIPRCTMTEVVSGSCPRDAAVGTATVAINTPGTESATPLVSLVYNIVPYAGEPAAFAFTIENGVAQARLDASVRSGGDYGVHIAIADTSEEAPILYSSVTLWGVPERHNGQMGPDEAFPNALNEPIPFGGRGGGLSAPFLTLPSYCSGKRLNFSLSSDSWQDPTNRSLASTTLPALTGCEMLSFAPSLEVKPDTLASGAPVGYRVGLHVPQNEDPDGLATPDVRDVQMTLPQGVVVSPSVANGLQACAESEFEPHSGNAGKCRPQSTIGSVKITTPLLSAPLEGRVFLGQPGCTLCTPTDAKEGRMAPLLLEAEGYGVVIKLVGKTSIDQATGQLTTAFTENPQLPFSDVALSLKGGEDAPLVNPEACGPATAVARLTPWSTITATEVAAPAIPIANCEPHGFSPSFVTGMTKTAQAGAYSGFSVVLSRNDDDQNLGSVSVTTPPGLLGTLKNVARCVEVDANTGTCPESSRIGSDVVTVGPGRQPYTISGGKVFLTGPYHGAPFGLSIVTPTKAGPFTLSGNTGAGTEVVRASIGIDSHSAQVHVTSDPLPTMLDGIPLDIRQVVVNVDREGFMFNPTDCDPLSASGVITSSTGTAVDVSYPFQSVNCATLGFKPKFAASTQARTSKANGASLAVKVAPTAGQANIGKVRIVLPKQLPARLTTLQKACTDTVFNANPSACPAASAIGTAVARTPVLAHPLTGPIYLVSHGGVAFPDAVIILQGEGVTLYLDGNTNIKKGITTSTFNSVPDAPVTSFEAKLPEGPHSAFATNIPTKARGSLCGLKLTIPTTLTGQNGAVLTQTTKIAVTGCPKKKAKKAASAHHGKGKS